MVERRLQHESELDAEAAEIAEAVAAEHAEAEAEKRAPRYDIFRRGGPRVCRSHCGAQLSSVAGDAERRSIRASPEVRRAHSARSAAMVRGGVPREGSVWEQHDFELALDTDVSEAEALHSDAQ
jgi:hypothetical protein